MLIAVIAASVGLVATLLGVFGVVIPENAPSFLEDVLEEIGNWGYWLLFLGLIAFVGGVWKAWSIVSDQKEFERLYNVDSKAKFQRNLEDLEYLAWTLGRDYPRRVEEKKEQFKI